MERSLWKPALPTGAPPSLREKQWELLPTPSPPRSDAQPLTSPSLPSAQSCHLPAFTPTTLSGILLFFFFFFENGPTMPLTVLLAK